MRSSATSLFGSGKLCWLLLITGVQAIRKSVNRVERVSSRSFRYDTLYPGAEILDSYQIQSAQGNTTSFESKPTPFHETPVFLKPPIIITLVLFLLFAAGLIAVFFYGHEIRSFFCQKLGRRNIEEPVVEEPALGFGFDGPTAAEVEALRWKEKEIARKPFWRHRSGISFKTPALVPELSLSPPVSLDDAKIPFDDPKIDETRAENAEHTGTENEAPGGIESLGKVPDHNAIQVVDR